MLRALCSQDWCSKLMWSFPSHDSISLVLELYEKNVDEMIEDGIITKSDIMTIANQGSQGLYSLHQVSCVLLCLAESRFPQLKLHQKT
jgi:hypothetical protein